MNLGRFVIFRQINREIKQNQTKHDKSPKKKEKLNIPPPQISNIHVKRTSDVAFLGKESVDPMARERILVVP